MNSLLEVLSASRPTSCPSCYATFKKKYTFKIHYRTHVKIPGGYRCKFCLRMLSKVSQGLRHYECCSGRIRNSPLTSEENSIRNTWKKEADRAFEEFYGTKRKRLSGDTGNRYDDDDGEPEDDNDGEPEDGNDGEPEDGNDGEPEDGNDGEPEDASSTQPRVIPWTLAQSTSPTAQESTSVLNTWDSADPETHHHPDLFTQTSSSSENHTYGNQMPGLDNYQFNSDFIQSASLNHPYDQSLLNGHFNDQFAQPTSSENHTFGSQMPGLDNYQFNGDFIQSASLNHPYDQSLLNRHFNGQFAQPTSSENHAFGNRFNAFGNMVPQILSLDVYPDLQPAPQ
ncbi:unnamed protein product [Fusarium graminearum]|nr:unnamed protein product [Fusarium graminearum]